MEIPTLALNDGNTLPAIGFGTFPLRDDEGVDAMVSALAAGYRLLDSAVNYRNEAEVGEALRRSGLPREQVQVTTKVPGRFHAEELALASVRDSAEAMGVEQLDLVLIHWPNPSQRRYHEAWRALVRAQQDGLVRSIGVSNFTAEHLRRVIDDTGVVPAVNQVELHPHLPQEELRAVHAELGIVTESWSPIGKGSVPLDAPAISTAAEAHGVTAAQAVLRWHTQLGAVPLPKSADPERQRQNLDVHGFTLSDEQVAGISAMRREDGRRFGGDPDVHEEM